MKIYVCVRLNPTEDLSKVKKAVENIFPSLNFTKKDDIISASGSKGDLEVFKKHLQIQNICATASQFLSTKIDSDSLEFELNKQAALMGKVNFIDFSAPLGTIKVTITGKNLQELIDYLCS